MTPKGPEIYADAPNPAEVVNKIYENSEQGKDFAKEKISLNTELGLVQQQRDIRLSTVEEDTHNDTDDLAESSDPEYQNILTNLPQALQHINENLRFTARKGKTREIRKIAREYRREFVKDMKYTCKTLGIYFRKLKNGSIGENMITPAQMTILNAKTQARHDKIKGFVGDTLTADNPGAERGRKKDLYVGPNMKTSTDGIEVRGTCTPAEAEATMSRCQGGGSLAKQERCKFVEEKTGIRQNLDKFLTPTGSNIVTGAVKMIPTIVQIRGGVKAVKAGFSLIFGKGGEAEWKNLAIGTAMFGAVTFLDPTKSYETLKNTFGDFFGKGKNGLSSTAIDNKSIRNEIIEGSASTEKIRDEYAPQLIGKALAGLTMGEVKELGIMKYSGEKPVGINFDVLKGHYRKKIAGGDNRKDLYAELLRDTKYLEDVMKARPNDNIIEHGFDGTGLGKDAFEAPDNKDILVGTYVSHTLKAGGIVVEYFEQKGLEDKIMQSPTMKEYITTYGTDKFMKEIMKLPQEIREQIYAGDITFEMKDGKLIMNINEQQVGLDLITHRISLMDNTGTLQEFGDGAEDNLELMDLATIISREIKANKGKFMADEPLFYNKDIGERGHAICATTGPRTLDKPLSWINGQSVKILDAQSRFGLFGDKGLKKFKDENVLDRFTGYLNRLHIWKGNTSEAFINNDLKARIAAQYPTLTPADHEQILRNHLGLYNTRGNLGALLYNNGVWAKDKAIDISTYVYTTTKELLGTGREKLRTAANSVISWTVEKGEVILTFAGNKTMKLRDWLKGFYPKETIDNLRKKFSDASDKQRGVVGKGANWIFDFLFGIELFGENKQKASSQDEQKKKKESTESIENKKKNEENPTTSPTPGIENKEKQVEQRYGISKKLIPNEDFYIYLNEHTNGSAYMDYMKELSTATFSYTNKRFVKTLANGSQVLVETDIINKLSTLQVIQDYRISKNISSENAISGLKRNIQIREREYRPLSKKAGYWIHGAAESVVGFGADIVGGLRNGIDKNGEPTTPPNPPAGTAIGTTIGSGIRTGFGWIRDGAKRTVSQGANVVTGGATNAFDGDKDNAKDIK